jgi:hypothetical protein
LLATLGGNSGRPVVAMATPFGSSTVPFGATRAPYTFELTIQTTSDIPLALEATAAGPA